jgi:hypothetical protein
MKKLQPYWFFDALMEDFKRLAQVIFPKSAEPILNFRFQTATMCE